jgi:hypothetical protein
MTYFLILQMEAACSSRIPVDLRQTGIISQKIELFVTTTMRTSNSLMLNADYSTHLGNSLPLAALN